MNRPSNNLKVFISQVIDGTLVTIDTVFPMLNRLAKPLQPRTINLLCGCPGSGKSLLALQLLLAWLLRKIHFSCYMLEESLEHHLHRAIALLEDNTNILDMSWIRNNPDTINNLYAKYADTLDALSNCLTTIPQKQETYEGLTLWAEQKLKAGSKLLIIDPVTAIAQQDKPWIYDAQFLQSLRRLLVDYNATALITIHPRKGLTKPTLDDLAGGSAWQRFTETILWIEAHGIPETMTIKSPGGIQDIKINRTIHILKARNAPGAGLRIGYKFGKGSLLFAEQGLILKKINVAKKEKDSGRLQK